MYQWIDLPICRNAPELLAGLILETMTRPSLEPELNDTGYRRQSWSPENQNYLLCLASIRLLHRDRSMDVENAVRRAFDLVKPLGVEDDNRVHDCILYLQMMHVKEWFLG
ncbi:MAG: hypothetical protein LBF65_02935 [Holosporales bacterium]|nr:hypothetical protein [Holosporales bacterium]